jgi:solute:Na+ symporter, SSS family
VTALLVVTLAFLAVYGVYIAALAARVAPGPSAFLDGGANLPGWAAVFAGAGIAVVGPGLYDHLILTSRFGLSANHVAVGLVLAALTAVLVQKRLWVAARIAGLTSPGEALGRYYASITLRLAMLTLAALFALPFSANLLSQLGQLIAEATGRAVPQAGAIWIIAFFLFLPAVIGGWRAIVFIVAVQSVLLAVLLATGTGFAELTLTQPGFLETGIPVANGILADRIPGVVRFSAGIGKDVAPGGIFTTVGIASTALSLIGVVLSPGFLYLAITVRAGKSAAFAPVWLIAGLGAGLLLFLVPFLAARLSGGLAPVLDSIFAVEPFGALALLLALVIGLQMTVAFFVSSGALLVSRELIVPYVLPGLSARAQRLAARIGLAVAFALAAALAAFAPLGSAVVASLTVALSVQLLPALLGLTFVRWISRGAVLTGLIAGSLLVVFTEPFGLIVFEGLFVELPWGRWPLTVHSAAWGLAFNIVAVLLVSIFTRRAADRPQRERLHDEFAARWQTEFGGPTARGAKWSLTLIWAFLALGPGAILGNTFFSQPIFAGGDAALGVASLWVWQLFFWLIGVALVWWLAYPSRLGVTSSDGLRPIALGADRSGATPRRAPDWIAAGLARVTER